MCYFILPILQFHKFEFRQKPWALRVSLSALSTDKITQYPPSPTTNHFFQKPFSNSKTNHYICTSFRRKKTKAMKKDLHPSNYRLVVFKDMSNDYSFLTKSCIDTRESVKWEDGNEYPLVKLEISHTSHPFYTGKMKLVDTAGRVDKFRNRYKKKEAAK